MKPAAVLVIAALGLLGASLHSATRSAAETVPAPGVDTFATALSATAGDMPTASVDIVAAIQFAPEPGNPAINRKRLAGLIEEAADRGARIVVLPELAVTGPLAGDAHGTSSGVGLAEPIPGPTTATFSALAKKRQIWIGLSLAERAPIAAGGTAGTAGAPGTGSGGGSRGGGSGGGYFITSVLFDDHGHLAHTFRKVMVRPDGRDGDARRGDFRDIVESVDAGGLRLGILSGDDIQAGVPRLANRGTDTILISAAWHSTDVIQWRTVAEALAKQYQVNLMVANRRTAGDPSTLEMDGVYSWLGGVIRARAQPGDEVQIAPLGKRRLSWRSRSARGLPSTVPVPLYAGATAQTAELGRKLFFDPRLSSTGTVSCASCHLPTRAFTNGERKGVGVFGRTTKRNVPTLLNVAFRPLLQWDGYASSLENFAKYPISNVDEMNSHYLDKVPATVRADPEYARGFEQAMRVTTIDFEDISAALAAYLRTLISGDSAYDRFAFGGDRAALSAEAQRGLRLFTHKARCSTCHVIGERDALFMDLKYHVTGVGFSSETKIFNDIGLGSISTDEQTGLFQTPSLRNVAETAPYMHDGSLDTLAAVIDYYDRGGNQAPRRDALLQPLRLNPAEKRDLIAFLRSLSGAQTYTEDGRRVEPSDQTTARNGGQK